MNRIAAASGAFNAFGSISCMLIVKRIWTCHMEFVLYKLIIIIIISKTEGSWQNYYKRVIKSIKEAHTHYILKLFLSCSAWLYRAVGKITTGR